MPGILTRLVFFTKLRKVGKANAIGLIVGGCVYFALGGVNSELGLDPASFEAFLFGTSLGASVATTKVFKWAVVKWPSLQKAEGEAEELIEMVPMIESDKSSYPNKD